MSPLISLACARRRRRGSAEADPCAGAALTQPLPDGLQALYRELARGAADTMPQRLREWLRCWARRRGIDQTCLQHFVSAHGRGLSTTIDAARHDAATATLLAPELLVALLGLDQDPDALRADWPTDRSELDTLADTFGRPFAH